MDYAFDECLDELFWLDDELLMDPGPTNRLCLMEVAE